MSIENHTAFYKYDITHTFITLLRKKILQMTGANLLTNQEYTGNLKNKFVIAMTKVWFHIKAGAPFLCKLMENKNYSR